MNQDEIEMYISKLKQEKQIRVYTPVKYFQGLKSKTQIRDRLNEIIERKRNENKNYNKYKTDSFSSTKSSKYTILFYNHYGKNNTSLISKSHVTGVPIDILNRVLNRGLAAWKTGHRVGAGQQQWAYARVHSFLVLGCTIFGPDFDLFKEAVTRMTDRQLQKWLNYPIQCPKSKFETSLYFKNRLANYKYVQALQDKYIKQIK